MTKTLKTAQKPRRHVETEDHFVNALVLPPSNVASSVHIYLRNFSQYKYHLQATRKGLFDNLIILVILQPSCRVLTQTLVLPYSSQTCEVIPLGSTSSCIVGSSMAAPPCVDQLRLWFYGRSEIESKSSWFRSLSPRRLVASNLGRYKASYPPLFAASYLVISNLLS